MSDVISEILKSLQHDYRLFDAEFMLRNVARIWVTLVIGVSVLAQENHSVYEVQSGFASRIDCRGQGFFLLVFFWLLKRLDWYRSIARWWEIGSWRLWSQSWISSRLYRIQRLLIRTQWIPSNQSPCCRYLFRVSPLRVRHCAMRRLLTNATISSLS